MQIIHLQLSFDPKIRKTPFFSLFSNNNNNNNNNNNKLLLSEAIDTDVVL